jgi:hypothetical protein
VFKLRCNMTWRKEHTRIFVLVCWCSASVLELLANVRERSLQIEQTPVNIFRFLFVLLSTKIAQNLKPPNSCMLSILWQVINHHQCTAKSKGLQSGLPEIQTKKNFFFSAKSRKSKPKNSGNPNKKSEIQTTKNEFK